MTVMEDIKAALAPLLEDHLQPIHSELRSQAELLQKVLEEVASLHIALAQMDKGPAFDGNQSFADLRTVRKSLSGLRPASGDMKAKAEEAKSKKSETAAKAKEAREAELKRKAEEQQRKEEERTAKEKARKEAESKRLEAKKEQDEDAKRKREEVRPKGRTASGLKLDSAKAEEAKKKVVPHRGERKSMGSQEIPSDKEVRVSPLLTASEEPAVQVDPLPSSAPEPPAVSLPVLEPLPPLSELGSHPVDAELKALYHTHGEQVLNTPTAFALSLGAKSALSLLSTIDDTHLYLSTDPIRDEVYWVFRLFFQLCGQTLSDVKVEAWTTCRAYLTEGKASGLEQHILQSCQNFDFSNANIDKVEGVLGSKWDRLNPSGYNTFCQLSSLVMFAVKEAVVYAGLVPEKAQPWRKCQRLLHLRSAPL